MSIIRKYKISKVLGNTDNLTSIEKEIIQYSIDFVNHLIKKELKGVNSNELHYTLFNIYNKVTEVITLRILNTGLVLSMKDNSTEPLNHLIDYLMRDYYKHKSISISFDLNKSEVIVDNKYEKEFLYHGIIKLNI